MKRRVCFCVKGVLWCGLYTSLCESADSEYESGYDYIVRHVCREKKRGGGVLSSVLSLCPFLIWVVGVCGECVDAQV